MSITEIIKTIKRISTSFDIDALDEQIELLEQFEDLNEYKDLIMDSLFLVLENNPNEDFGSPGEIVHFLENFYRNGYENKLMESLTRKPTIHTVWMFNRIINSLEGNEFEKYLSFMKNLLNRDDIDSDLKTEISDFLNYQN